MYATWFLELDDAGQPVGVAWSGRVFDACVVGIAVRPAQRGRGVGRRLLAELVDRIDGPVSCGRSDGADPAVAALARRFGFVEQPEGEPSHWRSGPLSDTTDDVEAEVLTAEHLDDPAFVERFAPIAVIADLEAGVEPSSADEIVSHERRRIERGGFTVLVRDRGEPVACATTSAAPWSPWLTSDHTLVLPQHRGNGYGLAATRAQHAVAARRGYERVVTDVRPEKAHMLAILRRLGYRSVPTPGWVRP
jgi:GNAT superfamily N-acetyltransferase